MDAGKSTVEGGANASPPDQAPREDVAQSPPTDVSAAGGAGEQQQEKDPTDLAGATPLARVWEELGIDDDSHVPRPDAAGLSSVAGFAAFTRTVGEEWAGLFRHVLPDDKVSRHTILRNHANVRKARPHPHPHLAYAHSLTYLHTQQATSCRADFSFLFGAWPTCACVSSPEPCVPSWAWCLT
jgi:hypothetical protein